MIYSLILLLGLSAQVSDQMTTAVIAPPSVVIQYIKTHPNELPTAAKWTVIERRENAVRIWRSTPKGPIDITVLEDISTGETWANYTATLYKNNVRFPTVARQTTTATISAYGTGSRITVRVNADVNGLSQTAVNVGVRQSLRGLEKFFDSKFGRHP